MRIASGIKGIAIILWLLAAVLATRVAAAAGPLSPASVDPAAKLVRPRLDLAGNPATDDWILLAPDARSSLDGTPGPQGQTSANATSVLTSGLITPGSGMIPGRLGASVIHDPAPLGGQLIVFGGYNGGYLDDVWAMAFDGTPSWERWTTTGQSITPRTTPASAWDAHRGRLLVFGGFDGTNYLNDVWALSVDGSHLWTRLEPEGPLPPTRTAGCAVYDPIADKLVVFGGTRFGSYLNDVWVLSLSGTPAWQQVSPSGVLPKGRQYAAAAWDATRGRMLVFGGYDGTTLLSDTWALSLSGSVAWSLVSASGMGPSPRTASGAVYDSPLDRMLVFGGSSAQGSLNDLWALSLASRTWGAIAVAGNRPSGRWAPGFVHDTQNGRWLVFGGYGGGYLTDTWKLFTPTPPPPPPRITEPTADSFWLTGEVSDQRVSWQDASPAIRSLSVQYSPTGTAPWSGLATGISHGTPSWVGHEALPAVDAASARVRVVGFDLDGEQLVDTVGPAFGLGHHASIRIDLQRYEGGPPRHVSAPPVLFWDRVPGAATYEVSVRTDAYSSCSQRTLSFAMPAARNWIQFDPEIWHAWPASRNELAVQAFDASHQPVGPRRSSWFNRYLLADLDPTHFVDPRPPVLLVHGWVSDNSTWAMCGESPLADALANGNGTGAAFHPWAFEYPNIGSVRTAAAGLSAAVDYVRGQSYGASIRLVGHSMGGLVSRAYLEGFAEDPNTREQIGAPWEGTISHLATLATPHLGEPFDAVRYGTIAHSATGCPGDPLSDAAADLQNLSGLIRDLNRNGVLPAISYFFSAGTDPQGELGNWLREIALALHFVCAGANDAAVDICSGRSDCVGLHPYPMAAFEAGATITHRQYGLSHNRMSKPGNHYAECDEGNGAKMYDENRTTASNNLLRDLLDFLRCGSCLTEADCPGLLVSKVKYKVTSGGGGAWVTSSGVSSAIESESQGNKSVTVPGTIVTIRSVDADAGTATFVGATNAAGELAMDLEPGGYVVSFQGRGYVPRDETLVVAAQSAQVTSRVDLQPDMTYVGPRHPQITVFGGGPAVTDSMIVLQLACDDASQVLVSDSLNFGGAVWSPLVPTVDHVIHGEAGLHTLWAKYRDDAGRESDIVSAVVDFAPHSAGQLVVDGGGGTAQILVDDIPTGLTTPAIVAPIGPGYHRVALSAPGMRAQPPVVVVLVDSAGSAEAHFVLVPSQAPSATQWTAPSPGAVLAAFGRLGWSRALDPDGGTVFYDLSIALDSAQTSGVRTIAGLADTGIVIPGTLSDSTEVYAMVRAIDGHETPQVEAPAVLRFLVDRTVPSGRVEFPAAGSKVFGDSPPALRFRVADWSGPASAMVLLSVDGGESYRDTLYHGAYIDSIPWAAPPTTSTTCRIRLRVGDRAGNVATIDSDSVFTLLNRTTGVGSSADAPMFSLAVRPVPTRSGSSVVFQLPESKSVRIEVFDAAGRSVRLLASGRFTAGEHLLPWDVCGNDGRRLAAGAYFVRLRAGSETRMIRTVITR